MTIRNFFQWLLIITLLSVINACGGGGDGAEPSSLLSDTYRQTTTTSGGGGNTTTTPTTTTEGTDVSFTLRGQVLIPAGGITTLTLNSFKKVDSTATVTDLVIVPNLTFTLSVTGDAVLQNGQKTLDLSTDDRGEVSFTVSHPGVGNVLLTMRGRGNYTGGGSEMLYFGASVTADLLTKEQVAADGTSGAKLVTTVRDGYNLALQGIPVELSFSLNSLAVATEAIGTTDAQGLFTTEIKDTIAQTITVTAYAGGMASRKVEITFGGIVTSTFPATLDFIIKKNNVAADGKTAATVVVVARDNNGTPILNIPISIGSYSATALMQVANSTPTPYYISVDTGTAGSVEINITDTVEEEVIMTAKTAGKDSLLSIQTSVIFKNPDVTAGTKVAKIELDPVINDGALAGSGQVTLMGRVVDDKGNAVAGETITVLISGGSAVCTPVNGGKTNSSGFFIVHCTDTQAEQFSVRITLGNISSSSTTIKFVAVTKTEDNTIQPNTVTLLVNPTTGQLADGKSQITLTVIARDINGTPMNGIPVWLSGNGTLFESAVFDAIMGTTGSGGTATFNVSSAAEGEFSVTVSAQGATIISDTETVRFFKTQPSLDIKLSTTVVDDKQVANGQDAVRIDVLTLDSQNRPVANAPITIRWAAPNPAAFTVDPATGTTGPNGLFSTKITATAAGLVTVTVSVDGTNQVSNQTVTFIAVQGQEVTTLGKPELQVFNSPQPADGTAEITLLVITRDDKGTPVAGVDVELVSASTNATFAATTGKSNPLGEFRTTVKSKVVETFNVTPVVTKENMSVTGDPKAVQFIAVDVSKQIDLQVLNSPQPADGTSVISLVVVARTAEGKPAKESTVTLLPDSSTVKINPATGKTNHLGEFRATVTNTVAEKVTVVPVVDDTVGVEKVLEFTPIGQKVKDLTVTAVNDKQLADGKTAITISVIARDDGGRPVAKAPIVVRLPTSTVAVADPSKGVTNENGYFKTDIISSVAGEVAVTVAVADTNVAHPPVIITFLTSTDTQPTTVELLVENAPKPADDSSLINLIVIPRDAKGTPLPSVDIEIITEADAVKVTTSKGKTNALGEFRTTVKSSVAGTYKLTPVAGNLVGTPVEVIFTPIAIPIPDKLTLTATSNNLKVGEEVKLIVLASKNDGTPMGKVPVTLSVMPANEPPDVTGSAIFGSNGFKGETAEGSGVFETAVTNSRPGTFKVKATVGGTLNSNIVEITFVSAPDDKVKEVSTLSLITDKVQIGSEGTSEGAVITAILKDKNNNLVEGAVVNFSTDSGEIRPIVIENSTALAGVSDASGRAQARLTTASNHDNRTITVRATTPTTSGELRVATITIEVIGTTITISGPASVIVNTDNTYVVTLKDNANNGIKDQTLTLTSALGNTFTPKTSFVTNALGQIEVIFTASHAGEDTITASKSGATEGKFKVTISDDEFIIKPLVASHGLCTSLTKNEDLNNNRLLDPGEDLNVNNILDLGCQVPLDEEQSFQITWQRGGAPQVNERIVLSTTRGILSSNEVITGLDGSATFSISSRAATTSPADAGNAIVTVRTQRADGPSQQFELKFVARAAASITAQANPSTIGVNPTGTDTERSEILAVVRDAENNLVYGKVVNFVLNDVTGGRLTQGSAITDDFGRASTVYIAGPSSSASGGVSVKATVADTPSVSATVTLTVAKKALFVAIGSGNTLVKDTPGIKYSAPHTVLVTDAGGTPVADTTVMLSIYPSYYYKGFIDSSGENTQITITAPCPNEDVNRNGLLDPGEDINGNRRLDPGNVITVDNSNLKSGVNGFGDFNVVYAIQYADWIDAEITAFITAAGSESSDILNFTTVCLADDVKNKICPLPSPFGVSKDCSNPN